MESRDFFIISLIWDVDQYEWFGDQDERIVHIIHRVAHRGVFTELNLRTNSAIYNLIT